jgi:hypothetical protein
MTIEKCKAQPEFCSVCGWELIELIDGFSFKSFKRCEVCVQTAFREKCLSLHKSPEFIEKLDKKLEKEKSYLLHQNTKTPA